jgi:hypothetical protein
MKNVNQRNALRNTDNNPFSKIGSRIQNNIINVWSTVVLE